MSILDIPWYDRPGARLIKYGAGALTDSDLLGILLGNVKNSSVITLSNKLLTEYNLNKLGELSFNELKKECNDDSVAALKILSFIELSKRKNKLMKGGYNHKPIKGAEDIYKMFSDHIDIKKKEYLYAVLLDSKNNVIKIKRVSEGTLNSSLIHPREVFKDAIKESANSIILVHNHPSGDPKPSDEDIEMTEKLIKFGEELGINILDHVIIGDGTYWNLLDNKP